VYAGPEIWDQSGGHVDAFVDFVGSGGTFAGCSAFLKEKNPDVLCYVIEPTHAVTLGSGVTSPDADRYTGKHKIQGGGYSIPHDKLTLLAKGCIDGYLTVSDEEAADVANRLAREEGIFCGFSAGCLHHILLTLDSWNLFLFYL
jgi:cysteine synthase A